MLPFSVAELKAPSPHVLITKGKVAVLQAAAKMQTRCSSRELESSYDTSARKTSASKRVIDIKEGPVQQPPVLKEESTTSALSGKK